MYNKTRNQIANGGAKFEQAKSATSKYSIAQTKFKNGVVKLAKTMELNRVENGTSPKTILGGQLEYRQNELSLLALISARHEANLAQNPEAKLIDAVSDVCAEQNANKSEIVSL